MARPAPKVWSVVTDSTYRAGFVRSLAIAAAAGVVVLGVDFQLAVGTALGAARGRWRSRGGRRTGRSLPSGDCGDHSGRKGLRHADISPTVIMKGGRERPEPVHTPSQFLYQAPM
jgi:hypothetical protein